MRVPPRVLGPVDDADFRWVVDVGLTGPDKGAGGDYLFVPPVTREPCPRRSEPYGRAAANVSFGSNCVIGGEEFNLIGPWLAGRSPIGTSELIWQILQTAVQPVRSLHNPVGLHKNGSWYRQSYGACRSYIHNSLKLCRLLDRQGCGFCPF